MSDGQQQDPNTNAPGAQEPPIDWHDKFLGQKKVNTDLEAKLKAAYEKADRVDDLEKQVADWEQRGKEFDSAQATIAGLQQQVLQANALVTAHPYLAQGGNNAGLAGIIPPSGVRDGDHQAGQLTRDDLKNMTPKQIEEARRKGRLDDLLAGRSK